jgi:hypothetical protein
MSVDNLMAQAWCVKAGMRWLYGLFVDTQGLFHYFLSVRPAGKAKGQVCLQAEVQLFVP